MQQATLSCFHGNLRSSSLGVIATHFRSGGVRVRVFRVCHDPISPTFTSDKRNRLTYSTAWICTVRLPTLFESPPPYPKGPLMHPGYRPEENMTAFVGDERQPMRYWGHPSSLGVCCRVHQMSVRRTRPLEHADSEAGLPFQRAQKRDWRVRP